MRDFNAAVMSRQVFLLHFGKITTYFNDVVTRPLINIGVMLLQKV